MIVFGMLTKLKSPMKLRILSNRFGVITKMVPIRRRKNPAEMAVKNPS